MIEEQELIKRIQQGEQVLFNHIIVKHQKLVYFSILKMLHGRTSEAEDLTQEVFISAYRAFHHFQQDSSLTTWLLRIATNKVIDYKRKKQLETVPAEINIEQLPSLHDPLKQLLEQESSQLIQRVLAQLPATYRLVIEQYYYKNMSYKEIAFHEGVEVKTVESRLYRARSKLKNLWKEENKHDV
jgi:RNA polymerase sigma factor (sigma-70 family)